MTADNTGDLVWSLSKGFCISFISLSPSLVDRLNFLALFEKTGQNAIYLFFFFFLTFGKVLA